MLFSSIEFIFYFLPAVLLGYFAVSFSRVLQNLWLLIASLVFYAWGEPLFVLVMILSILMNWFFGLLVDRWRDRDGRAKKVIWATVIFNVGILFIYKYLDFVIANLNALFGVELLAPVNLPLPLGISFFTFQAMSYVLDVYRKDAPVERNPFYVGLYVSLFPQLVAGPIVRYLDVATQLRGRRMSWEMFSSGCCRFVIGVGKKILIANAMGAVSDRVFDLSASGSHVVIVPAMLAWVGLIAYTLQIYFDFSSYSDMALGLGKMFGFTFRENFNYPYIAKSVTEFWRRWHISLSTWFREYIYIPLGGSHAPGSASGTRSGTKIVNQVRNLFVVWLVTGIWHGANWTFICWGMWYFVLILFERVTKFSSQRLPAWFCHAYLIFVVMIGWMFFRATSVHNALGYLANLLALNNNGFYSDFAWLLLRENAVFFFCGIVFSTPVAREFGNMLANNVMGIWGRVFSTVYPFMLAALFLTSVVYLTKGSYTPFIYFNF